nr:hypothetical protein [Tanacetum cinerariifolium]
MENPSEATTTTIPIPSKVQDKGKGIMAKIEADFELAQILQAKEQEQLTDDEKAKLFMEFLEKRRKFFAAKRAPRALKNKPFAEIKELFDKAMTRINNFVDFRTELVKESSKKAVQKEQEISWNDRDDVTIDATPLSSKSPTIVDYKIYHEGKKSYFQIFRADARFENVKPMDHMDSFLLYNSKTMFEHHVEDSVWKNQQGLVKMYPLTNHTLHKMFNDVKLQVDYEREMAFELLRLVKKQLKKGYVSK